MKTSGRKCLKPTPSTEIQIFNSLAASIAPDLGYHTRHRQNCGPFPVKIHPQRYAKSPLNHTNLTLHQPVKSRLQFSLLKKVFFNNISVIISRQIHKSVFKSPHDVRNRIFSLVSSSLSLMSLACYSVNRCNDVN